MQTPPCRKEKNLRPKPHQPRLLPPQKIEMPDDTRYFYQEQGTPQGLPSSPVLFNTYLDDLLQASGLLENFIQPYPDDIVIAVRGVGEL